MDNYSKLIREKTNIKPNTILEIGSRDGDDANFLKAQFSISNENVFIVEANPNQQIFIANKYPNYVLFTNAISNVSGELDFIIVNSNDKNLVGISSLINRHDKIYDKLNSKTVKVVAITGHQLLHSINKDIDLCKIDVEGHTYEVLESFNDKLKMIKSIHIECEHKEIWVGQKLYGDVKEFLIRNNFIQIYFKLINGGIQSDSIWVNKNYISND